MNLECSHVLRRLHAEGRDPEPSRIGRRVAYYFVAGAFQPEVESLRADVCALQNDGAESNHEGTDLAAIQRGEQRAFNRREREVVRVGVPAARRSDVVNSRQRRA
jgi:hypothetical protein